MKDETLLAEVYIGAAETPVHSFATFRPGESVGRTACHECGGTGWWGYGPVPETNGPCIDCKGTGREWVALW